MEEHYDIHRITVHNILLLLPASISCDLSILSHILRCNLVCLLLHFKHCLYSEHIKKISRLYNISFYNIRRYFHQNIVQFKSKYYFVDLLMCHFYTSYFISIWYLSCMECCNDLTFCS